MTELYTLSRHARPAHKSATRTFGAALTLGTFTGWTRFALVAFARLTLAERAALTWAILKTLPQREAQVVFQAVTTSAAPASEAERTAAIEYRASRDGHTWRSAV